MPEDIVDDILPFYAVKMMYLDSLFFAFRFALLFMAVDAGILIAFEGRRPFPASKP